MEPATITWPRGQVSVKPYQIIVWISVSPFDVLALPANAPRFPAVLDTGTSHNFSIREEQLVAWAGIQPRFEGALGRGRVRGLGVTGQEVPLLGYNVWLHPNRPGQRDQYANRPPFCLEMPTGIMIFSRQLGVGPRLPLLGLRGLVTNELQLVIDGKARHVSLRTARRFWPFG
jgi:hypothetical protein